MQNRFAKNLKFIQLLIKTKIDDQRRLELVIQAIKQGARVNASISGNMPIFGALQLENPVFLKTLLDHGANTDVMNYVKTFDAALQQLGDANKLNLVTMYKKLKQETDAPTKYTLRQAIQKGFVSIVKQMLPKLNLTAQKDKKMAELAKAQYEELKIKDPAYQEIGRIFQARLGVISDAMRVAKRGLIGVYNLPHDVADVIRQEL